MDQSVRGGIWGTLGTFTFTEGQTCEVTLSAADDPGYVVIADAVRIVAAEPTSEG